MKTALALFACLFISAMAFGKKPVPATTAAKDVATVHVYRSATTVFMLWNIPVKIGDKKFKVRNGGSYAVQVPAGHTTLNVCTVGGDKMEMDLEPGKEYYVKTFMRAGFLMPKVELAEVTENFAGKQMGRIKPKRQHSVAMK
jgi:hypothetical protein